MEGIVGIILVASLVLACPLMMVGMGVGAWLFARTRGEKKELSMACMGGHGEDQQPRSAEESTLKEEVARLQQEVQALKREPASTTQSLE